MKLDQLRYFSEVARHQHIGRASHSLAVTASAISHSIRALEDELNVALFVRSGRNLRITASGKRLAERTHELLSLWDEIRTEISAAPINAFSGSFRIGATHFLCETYLAPLWFLLQETHQDLRGNLESLHSAQVIERVLGGDLDFGFALNPQPHAQLLQEPIHRGTYVLVARREHPLVQLGDWERVRTQLERYPATLGSASVDIETCGSKHPVFKRYDIRLNESTTLNSFSLVIQKLKTSDSWSLIPDFFLKEVNKDLTVLAHPADWDAPCSINLVGLQSQSGSSVVAETLASELRKRLN